MAEVNITIADLLDRMTIEVSIDAANLFGWRNWRLRVASLLFALACRILGCRLEIKGDADAAERQS